MRTEPTMPDLACYGALLLRISLGLIYLGHSVVIKYMVLGLPAATAWFDSMGYPAALLFFVLLVEIIAGTALLLGVYTRWAALAVIPVALGATWSHIDAGSVLRGGDVGWEYPMLLVSLSLVQFMIGDGAFALRPSPGPSVKSD